MIQATAETIRAEIQCRILESAPDGCRYCGVPMPVPSELNEYGSHWSVGTMQGIPLRCVMFLQGIIEEVMAEYELIE